MKPFAASRHPRLAVIAQGIRRTRLATALGDSFVLDYLDSCDALKASMGRDTPSVVVIDPRAIHEPQIGDAIQRVAGSIGCPVVLYCASGEAGSLLVHPAVVDRIIVDRMDSPAMLQSIIRRVLLRGAADAVVEMLRPRLTSQLAAMTEIAVRYPDCATVEALATRLGVYRQTIALWCRSARIMRPEELLFWSRLLLVSYALAHTSYSITTISIELGFPSVIAARNQLKRYTGMTALEIRAAGFEVVLAQFDDCLATGRAPARRSSALVAAG